jgi:membrane fusion protein, multidrug efflux system
VQRAQGVKIIDEATAVGSLRARQSVMLRPEVAGRVARIGFADGQRVRRGQLMVQLDDTLLQAQLRQSQSQASIARTNLQRSRELQAQGFVSSSAVDQNAAALDVAEAQVALSQAQLARLRVLAPFDGVAGIRVINVGDFLRDGADIVAIEDLSSLLVDFRLPERELPRLRVGLPVEVAVDAFPGRNFQGRVEALDAQVDANGRSLLVRARVDNPGAQLKGGLFARPRVVFGVRDNAVVVPEEALVPQGGRQFLFKVVDGENSQKLARRMEAKLGVRMPGRVEILEGLKPDDMVVTAGHGRLRGESTPVRVIDLARAAAPRPPGGGAGGGGPGGGGAGSAGGGSGAAAPGAPVAPVARGAASPAKVPGSAASGTPRNGSAP